MKWTIVKGEVLKRGMTLRALAAQVGHGYSLVLRVCDGSRHSRDVQEAIAEFLKIPSDRLFGRDHWTNFTRATRR